MAFKNNYTEDCFRWHKAFVILWQKSSNMTELCFIAGLDSRKASNIAAGLRRRGVELKRMHAGGRRADSECLSDSDIYELNRIIDQMEDEVEMEKIRKKVSSAS